MVWAPGGAWEEKTARQFCKDFLVNSSLAARQCQANVEAVTSRDAEDTCVEDIKVGVMAVIDIDRAHIFAMH